MVFRPDNDTTPDVRKLQLQLSQVQSTLNGPNGVLAQLQQNQQTISSLLQSQTTTIPAPVANLLYNGEIGHSVNTWYDDTYHLDEFIAKQAAWWWSHNGPVNAQTFTAVVVANEIPLPAHGMTTGTRIQFTNSGGGLPGGLSAGTNYFVIVIDSDTISVALTEAQAFVPTVYAVSVGGTGTQTVQQVLDELAQTPGSEADASLKSWVPNTTAPINVYNPNYCRWDSENGEAQITGLSTLDQKLPTNFIDASTPLTRVSMVAALANSFIEVPDNYQLGAGIWDNTVGQNKFLEGDVGFTATFVGTPDVPTGKTRKFRALLTSDRGFQILSSEVTVNSTPAVLDADHYIVMGWGQQAGQLQVDIYEHYDPGGAGDEYRLIGQVSASTSFIYQGGYIAVVPDYPTPTGSTRSSTYLTSIGDLSSLAINGVSFQWSTVNFPIEIPNNYNKANTTGSQWLRIFQSVPLDLYITSVITDGSATITIPDGAINSADFDAGGYGAGSSPYSTGAPGETLYFGLAVQVYDSDDALLATTSIDTVTSNTSIDLADTVAAGSLRKIRILGGGFHGLLVDKIHLGFQQNTSYAPNANDNRTLQPVAAPTSSDQGGVGGGGTGGGIVCVAGDTPIKMSYGAWKQIKTCRPGYMWASPGLKPNILLDLIPGFGWVRGVTTANGCYVEATDTERFVVDENNDNGTPLSHLREGDCVLTEIDGRVERSEIVEITGLLGKIEVYTPNLSDNRLFIGGRVRLSWWQKLKYWLTGRRPYGGFVLHNAKEPPAEP